MANTNNNKASFIDAIVLGYKNFFNFTGVASRREFWFFFLYAFLALAIIDVIFNVVHYGGFAWLDVNSPSYDRGWSLLRVNDLNFGDLLGGTHQLWLAIQESWIRHYWLTGAETILFTIPLISLVVRRMRDAGFGGAKLWFLLLAPVVVVVMFLKTKGKSSSTALDS